MSAASSLPDASAAASPTPLVPIASSRAEWDAARESLRQKEKELSKLKDALTLQRRALPWLELPVDFQLEDCSFDAASGTCASGRTSLSALFGTHPQLIVYNCMSFTADSGSGSSGYPCGACSLIIEQLDAICAALEKQADTAVAVICHGPPDRLRACAALRKWNVRILSCHGDFAAFVGAETEQSLQAGGGGGGGGGSRPTLSAFARGLTPETQAKTYLSYATWMRGVEDIELVCAYVDRLPIAVKGGRQPGFLQWREIYGEARVEQVPPVKETAPAAAAATAGGAGQSCCCPAK